MDWRALSRPCPEAVGTRIELVFMPDDPDPVPAGSKGTVTGGSGGQLWVDWDNGRSLCLVLPVDKYRVISRPQEDT